MAVSKGFSKFANIVTIVLIILIGLMIVIYITDVILSKNRIGYLQKFDPIRNFTIKKRDEDSKIHSLASFDISDRSEGSTNPLAPANNGAEQLRMRGGCGCNKYFGGCGGVGSQIDSLTFQPEKFLM